MFPPKADTWRRINHRTDQLISSRPSRISVPASWQDDSRSLSPDSGPQLRQQIRQEFGRALLSLEHNRNHHSSLESVASLPPPDCGGDSGGGDSGSGGGSVSGGRSGARDRADQFLRNLKSVHLFQSSLGVRDNREKLADYLKQCECSMPKHGNDQLTEIDDDLQATWNQPAFDKNCSAGKGVKQQSAIWELFQTELNILRHMKTIIEIYVTVIHYLQTNATLLVDVSTDKLFPNVHEVFGAHCTLWQQHLKPALLSARAKGSPVRPRDFLQGFSSFAGIFEPSLGFCLRITECKDYLRLQEKNEAFNDFVKWAQKLSSKNYNSEDGSMDLQLKSLLTMPFQRLTKYGLLLQEILRHTEDSEDREALEEMIRHVTDFCNRMNSRYQEKADEEEVRSVSERLEEVKLGEQIDSFGEECASQLEQFRLSLLRPMPHNGQPRRKLGEGDFRLKDDRGKWSEVKLIMFTDLLLLAKVGGKRQTLRPLRAPVRLDKLTFYRLSDNNAFVLAVLTDFGSIDCLLCLSATDQRQCDDWLERLSQWQASVKEQLQQQQLQQQTPMPCEKCGHRTLGAPATSCTAGAAAGPPKSPARGTSMTETLPSTAVVTSRPRSGTSILLEVSGATSVQQQLLMHAAHSSSELDGMARSPVQQQHCRIQHLHEQHQHQREKSAPAAGRSWMQQQQQKQRHQAHKHQDQVRCNSADETTMDATIPAKELTPERRRLISFISSSSPSPQV